MALLKQLRNGRYFVRFRCQVGNERKQFFKSCQTNRKDKAERVKARVEEVCSDITLLKAS